jgi:hypothetical protein
MNYCWSAIRQAPVGDGLVFRTECSATWLYGNPAAAPICARGGLNVRWCASMAGLYRYFVVRTVVPERRLVGRVCPGPSRRSCHSGCWRLAPRMPSTFETASRPAHAAPSICRTSHSSRPPAAAGPAGSGEVRVKVSLKVAEWSVYARPLRPRKRANLACRAGEATKRIGQPSRNSYTFTCRLRSPSADRSVNHHRHSS